MHGVEWSGTRSWLHRFTSTKKSPQTHIEQRGRVRSYLATYHGCHNFCGGCGTGGVVPHASSQDGRGMHVPHLVCACAVRVTKLFCTKRKWRAAHPFGDTPPSGGCACVCLSPLSRTYLVPIPPGPFPPGNGSPPRVFLRRGVRYLSAAARRERFRKYLRAEVREGNSVLPAPQKATQQQKHKPAPFFFCCQNPHQGKATLDETFGNQAGQRRQLRRKGRTYPASSRRPIYILLLA